MDDQRRERQRHDATAQIATFDAPSTTIMKPDLSTRVLVLMTIQAPGSNGRKTIATDRSCPITLH